MMFASSTLKRSCSTAFVVLMCACGTHSATGDEPIAGAGMLQPTAGMQTAGVAAGSGIAGVTAGIGIAGDTSFAGTGGVAGDVAADAGVSDGEHDAAAPIEFEPTAENLLADGPYATATVAD